MRVLFVTTLLVALILPSGHASGSSPIDISAEELQPVQTQAAKGGAKAQHALGALYAFGRGVRQDYAKARGWYEKAAAQGNAMAQYNLGSLYALGQGVPQDNVRAYMWFNLAADNRNRVASL